MSQGVKEEEKWKKRKMRRRKKREENKQRDLGYGNEEKEVRKRLGRGVGED